MSYVSMEKATKMLLVSRSTVLKWIKQQKLSARKTADDSYLINRDSVRQMLTSSGGLLDEVVNGTRPAVPCWEYHADGGEIKKPCRACPVFRDKKIKCYETGKFLKESGRGASCCPTDCEDCSYYASQRSGTRSGSAFPDSDVPHDSRNQASN